MSTGLVGLIEVQPKAVATFTALRWIGDEEDPTLLWMMERFGWKSLGMKDTIRKGRVLMLQGKNLKRYPVAFGDYVIALGAGGSMRVASQREFDKDYRVIVATPNEGEDHDE